MSEDGSGEPARPGTPLWVEYTDKAEAQIDEAYRWLLALPMSGEGGLAIAERWLSGLQRIVEEEAALQGGPFVLERGQSDNSSHNRPRYVLRYRTAGKRSSLWEVIYELLDTDEDAVMDTLRVVALFHAARDRS